MKNESKEQEQEMLKRWITKLEWMIVNYNLLKKSTGEPMPHIDYDIKSLKYCIKALKEKLRERSSLMKNKPKEIVLKEWCPGSERSEHERKIARINGNDIDIIIQTYNALERKYEDYHYVGFIQRDVYYDCSNIMLSDVAKIYEAWGKKKEQSNEGDKK